MFLYAFSLVIINVFSFNHTIHIHHIQDTLKINMMLQSGNTQHPKLKHRA